MSWQGYQPQFQPQQPWPPPPPPPPVAGPQSLKELFKVLLPAMLKGILRSLPVTIVLGLAALAVNTYIVVVRNDGFNKWDPSLPWWMKYIICHVGARAGATLFWTFLATMTSMFFSKLLSGALPQTLRNFFKAPSFIAQSFREAQGSVKVQLLSGAGFAWLVGAVAENPLVCLQATILTLGAISRGPQSLLMTILRLGHKDAQAALRPQSPPRMLPYGQLAFIVTGLAAGFVTALVMPKLLSNTYGYLIALVLLVCAFVFSMNQQQAPRYSAWFFLILYAGLLVFPALAHDGGWSENGANFTTWATSAGAPIAIVMGLGPVIGMIIGTGLAPIVINGVPGVILPPDPGPVVPPPPPPPAYPPEIEWTDPQGVTHILTYDSNQGAYVHNLTNGLVDPNNVEGWKQNIIGNQQQVDGWRDRNQQLEAAHQDSQSQALDAIQKDYQQRSDLLDKISHMEKAVLDGKTGLNDLLLVPPGSPGNILDNLNQIANQVASGDPIDKQKLNAITRLYTDTIKGAALTSDHLPQPETWSDSAGQYMDGVANKIGQLSTVKDDSGHFSWTNLGERVVLDVLSAGTAEVLFIPTDAVLAAKSYVDHGGDSILLGSGLAMVTAGLNLGLMEGGSRLIQAAPGFVQVGKDLTAEAGEALASAAQGGSSLAQATLDAAHALGNTADGASGIIRSLVDATKPLANEFQQLHDMLNTNIVQLPWEKPPVGDISRVVRPPVDTPGRDIQFIEDPTIDVSQHLNNIPESSQSALQDVADQHGVLIDTRPSNPMTGQRLNEGCLPKGSDLHNNTINPDDILLGAPENAEGLVGHFKPKVPENFDSLPRGDQERVIARFQQRWSEYANNNASLTSNPKFEVRGGVVYNASTGQAYTGDIDVMAIRDARTGQLVSAQKTNAVMNDLVDSNCGVEHNPHANWDYSGQNTAPPSNQPWLRSQYQQSQAIDNRIIDSHQINSPNHQALVTFRPNSQPAGTFLVGGQLSQ